MLFCFSVAVWLFICQAAVSAAGFDPELDGTMMPYNFAAGDSAVPWGDELRPVFINYVARHGARFLSSEKKVSDIEKVLEDARSKGRLTEKGKAFLRLLDKVRAATGGNWGALDAVGKAEEQRLGRQMAASCPELLKEGRVTAIATYVPRVVMTMYEVCHELARHSSYIEVYTSEGRQYDPMLRYFKTDKEYVAYLDSGAWLMAYDKYAREVLPTAPAASMVKGVADTKKLQKLSFDAYGVLQSLRAAGIDADAGKWFSEDEYRSCWEVANLRHYYQRSASPFSSLPAQCAAPILRDIIAKADSVFDFNKAVRIAETVGHEADHSNAQKAYLRFGHAETVIPLFALMRLPGCYAPLCNPAEVADRWKDYEVAPLGANLLIVCLEDGGGKRYASMRLNGRWVSFKPDGTAAGFSESGKRVIEWEKLRDVWKSYLP